jgi:hypothetical protein
MLTGNIFNRIDNASGLLVGIGRGQGADTLGEAQAQYLRRFSVRLQREAREPAAKSLQIRPDIIQPDVVGLKIDSHAGQAFDVIDNLP